MTVERESILNKIRALLSKTLDKGCTEAEAMAALGKAQALQDAYAITEAELNLTREEKAILRREPPGTRTPTASSGNCYGASRSSATARTGVKGERTAAVSSSADCHPMCSLQRGCSMP
jgi:hypothetical protein